MVELLGSQGELLIVKGNHDGDIEKIVGDVEIVGGQGVLERGMYVVHGHARPSEDIMEARAVVMGHVHPALAFRHRFGKVLEKVFLLCEWRGIPAVVLPAFSPLITGADVSVPENMIGPVARELENVEAFLLDGTYVGNIGGRRHIKHHGEMVSGGPR